MHGNLVAVDRRHFLRLSGLTAGALALPTAGLSAQRLSDRVLADPYAPLPSVDARRAPIQVTGRVHVAGRGVGGVRVSDGVSVVRTRTDGRDTLYADPLQRFVMISTPAGHAPARNATGTARFYQPLGVLDEQRVDFELGPAADDSAHSMLLLADPLFDDLALFPEYERAVMRMGVPLYQFIGNHEPASTVPAARTVLGVHPVGAHARTRACA